jgi:hypothetical protein
MVGASAEGSRHFRAQSRLSSLPRASHARWAGLRGSRTIHQVTGDQALTLLFAPIGVAFLLLAAARISLFDRISFWHSQAMWFRAHPRASWFPRSLWAGFGLTCLFTAVVAATKQ